MQLPEQYDTEPIDLKKQEEGWDKLTKNQKKAMKKKNAAKRKKLSFKEQVL